MATLWNKCLKRDDDRIIIHFDYDCFYAQVVENENPSLNLKRLPLAIQQKQIIVTCNYVSRSRGLHKLMLVSEAKKICPDVVIVLGEQLDRFRDASKMLYQYIESFSWTKKVERLGFDEVFMDVTDIIDYNQALLNPNDLSHAFFQLSREDPTVGFSFDATRISGHEYPVAAVYQDTVVSKHDGERNLLTRLILGSHLAESLRHKLEEEKGYTSTVGISTSKLLAKLVGNLHKPRGQTTLMPSYESEFIDTHEIGKIPGIGFKMSHKIRTHLLSRTAEFDRALIFGGTIDQITVYDVRLAPEMGPDFLEKLLGGPGAERGLGGKVWNLINAIDDTEVRGAKKVPSQISIEDSYVRLDTFAQLHKELKMLATSLIRRMHVDLLEDDEEESNGLAKRWIAHPKTIRLTTRPRPPLNSDGTRTRTFNRISRSGPLPSFIFNLREGEDILVQKLVQETLVPMFHRLHPEKHGWNLSLVNVCVTNMLETASDNGSGGGRDISRMFKHQDTVLKDWKVVDRDVPPDEIDEVQDTALSKDTYYDGRVVSAEPSAGDEATDAQGFEIAMPSTQNSIDDDGQWNEDETEDESFDRCSNCGAVMPAFAMAAHEQYHKSME